ncbi:MAG: hypothetical protein FJZ00_03265 [Candidatus Sericytochromatia bacterium]|uniref:MotA/TolQ/ExbB proton channel family protein n=1 Tax=Candidatus Tanganyikabacteria bacterium TaxID=2961651 RepID=A0A938BMM3_9BACT|nr:hypothetical protein [Candidatus Tanganyikabacteria bacterium]
MNLSGLVQAMGLAGGEWVLYLLLACSVISVTIIIDRVAYFFLNREPTGLLLSDAIAGIARGERGRGGPAKGPIGRMVRHAEAQ